MKKFHLFFEQSGTFKNCIKKLGGIAYDYDILNDFGETDYVIDLYNEIDRAYLDLSSVFDNIKENETIIAFFPCIRFEDQLFKKPTQYWFIGCKPKQNMLLEPITFKVKKTINECNGFTKEGQVERSMIDPQYVDRWLKMYMCDYIDGQYVL